MSNARWTRTTYQAATEITRQGTTFYFVGHISELKHAGISLYTVRHYMRTHGIKYRIFYESNCTDDMSIFANPKFNWQEINDNEQTQN